MRDQGHFFLRREVQQRQEQTTIEGIALTIPQDAQPSAYVVGTSVEQVTLRCVPLGSCYDKESCPAPALSLCQTPFADLAHFLDDCHHIVLCQRIMQRTGAQNKMPT